MEQVINEKRKTQKIFIYFDDSGVLHCNANERFFIYAGYIFLSQKEKDRALSAYRSAERQLRDKMTAKSNLDELKACFLKSGQKRFLNSVLRDYESLACIVDRNNVYDKILSNKKSIHRYKDYCLKLVVKRKLQELIITSRVDPHLPVEIYLFIDYQATSTNGIYNLRESILEEFRDGISNFNYSAHFSPIFFDSIRIEVSFCDSKSQVLVRACDLLANSYFYKYNFSKDMSLQNRHRTELFLP